MLIFNSDLCTRFTKLEIFSLCIASAVHDLDHPGVGNAFLIQTSHPIAILYNDIAVLESHHASKAFEIARSSDANIFSSLTMEQMRFCRKLIISTVLATGKLIGFHVYITKDSSCSSKYSKKAIYLAQHFQIINKFKGKLTTSSLKLEDEADRQLVLEMAVKCGDLGNPTKVFDESKRWSFLVMEEFFRQGDREKMLGLPVSKFMDRTDTNIPNQLGFIDVLVTPLFDTWAMFSQTPFTSFCVTNMRNNREQWQSLMDRTDEMPQFPESRDRQDNILDMAVVPVTFGRRGSMIPDPAKHVWLLQPRMSVSTNSGAIGIMNASRSGSISRTMAGVVPRSFGSSGSIARHSMTPVEANSNGTGDSGSTELSSSSTEPRSSLSVNRKTSVTDNGSRRRSVGPQQQKTQGVENPLRNVTLVTENVIEEN
eukprot:jgi/Hompol1/4911/HPOL_002090-RA